MARPPVLLAEYDIPQRRRPREDWNLDDYQLRELEEQHDYRQREKQRRDWYDKNRDRPEWKPPIDVPTPDHGNEIGSRRRWY